MVNLWKWYFQNMAEHRHPCLSRVCLTARIVNSIDFHQATVLHISPSPGADTLICAVVEHGGWYRCAWAIGSGTRACAMHEMQWLCNRRACVLPVPVLICFMRLSTAFSRFRFQDSISTAFCHLAVRSGLNLHVVFTERVLVRGST
jgi:hypothetical protein